MSIPSIVTRLQKIHEGLMTISSLQRLKDMSGKRTKPCTCAHHRSPSRSRCPRKCSSHGNRDKSLHCPCRERPKRCLCSRTSDDQSIIESSKRSDADEDFKLDSDIPTRPDRQIKVVDKGETTNLADRVRQKVTAGIASKDRIARTAARFDPDQSIIESSKRSDADEDFKLDSDFPTRPDRQIKVVDKGETTNLADRVRQKVTAGIASNVRIARTAARFDPDQSIIESSKRSDADEDFKLDSDFPTRPDRQIEVVDKGETTNLADRVRQKVTAGIASNVRIARTAARFDPDQSIIESSKRSDADEDFKLDTDFPTRPDRQIEVVDKGETTNLADRVRQKVTAGIASNVRIARTAARFDPDQSIIESSKRSDADEDFKLDSDFPTRPNRQIEVVDKGETTNLADRVGQKVPAGIASNDRIARTAARFEPDQTIIESSKRSDADEDFKLDSDFPTRPDRQIEVVDKGETTNLADRVGQKVPAGIASNDHIARTAARFDPGNGDGKPDSNRNAVASQTVDTVDRLKASDIDRANDDRKDVEEMYKELMAEKIRNRELEEKLEKTNCSLQCLKIEGEEQAACLKDALEKAKIQAELATHSRNLAVDIAKQSRNQTDLVKASRDEVLSQINVVKCDNSKLQCECDELRSKLREISENEEKKCAEVDDKVNRIKCAVKEKEMALASKKSELEETVAELTRLVKEQKKRICDLTSICTKQRSALQEHENCIAAKIAQLSERENRIQSMNCRCGSMDDEIEYLKCCLNEQAEARDKLQKAFDERQDNCNCELQIKDKIIADQVETIKKLKKLLQDSEKMAHQAAREFESLRDELHCLKQSNKSLRFALDEAEAQMSDECEIECCERCTTLEAQLRGLSEQKQKALIAAKCAAEKLCETTMNYQRQLDCEKQQHSFVVDLLQRKETEIELLKHEIRHIKEFGGRRLNHYNHQ